MYFWCFGFRGELGFLNCDDVCMCVVNKQFELLEFVSESVYVDLQYDFLLNFSVNKNSSYERKKKEKKKMRFLSLLLLGLCVCVVLAVLW